MLQKKIEEAFHNKHIAKLILQENANPVYGVFTGRINVISNISASDAQYSYRYYFKEVDMDEYIANKDIYKSMKAVLVIMQDQIADVVESIPTGFSK